MRGMAINRSVSRLPRLGFLLAVAIAGAGLVFGGCAMETASEEQTANGERTPATTEASELGGQGERAAATGETAEDLGREGTLRAETNTAPIQASTQAAPATPRPPPAATTGGKTGSSTAAQQEPQPQVSSGDPSGPTPWSPWGR